jgi:hypothetical protein
MIRRLLVLVAVLAATVVFAAPVTASAGTSQTLTFHGTFPTMVVGPLCGAPGGTLSGTGNAVMHMNVNSAGDFWFTSTQEEWFTLVQADHTLPTYTGHYAIWFGGSGNLNNFVFHDNFNVQATGSDGSTINIHIVDHMSISADGQLNVFTTCG